MRPSVQSGLPLNIPPVPPLPPSRLAPHPNFLYAFFSTWQVASAFNQPLSLDTSSVTSMFYMFRVRPARLLAHIL